MAKEGANGGEGVAPTSHDDLRDPLREDCVSSLKFVVLVFLQHQSSMRRSGRGLVPPQKSTLWRRESVGCVVIELSLGLIDLHPELA